MSAKAPWRDQLEVLLAAVCDGELSAPELAQLERLLTRSADARQLYLQYLHLHGELYWEQAGSAGGQPQTPAADRQVFSSSAAAPADDSLTARPGARSLTGKPLVQVLWALFAAAAVLVAVVLVRQATIPKAVLPEPELGLITPAGTVEQVVGAYWSGRSGQLEVGQQLRPGQRIALQHGLAALRLGCGARLIVRGPAELVLENPSCARVSYGVLTARAADRPAREDGPLFRIETPLGSVIDRGTEFGVWVPPDGPCEIHVFEGAVEVIPRGPQSDLVGDAGIGRSHDGLTSSSFQVAAGQAVCLRYAGDRVAPGRTTVEPTEFDSRRFVREIPRGGSVAAMRALVSAEPHLVHHWPLEGNCPEQVFRDQKGHLNLIEVVMLGGRGGGTLNSTAEGFDRTTSAVQPFRNPGNGNRKGVGLQTEDRFIPPPEMTVEGLFRYDGMTGAQRAPVAIALGTRSDQKHCGFLLAAAGRGRLTHLFDADAPWVESNLELVPGHWYYLAATFSREGDRTRLDVYAADLTAGETQLKQVLADAECVGYPPAGPLGIGKGFQEDVAHAYPWPGGIDEVAIYDAVLDRRTLQQHFDALVRRPTLRSTSPVTKE